MHLNQHMMVIGANGGIARGLIDHHLANYHPADSTLAASRESVPKEYQSVIESRRLSWCQCDNSEQAISTMCFELQKQIHSLDTIIICNGLLHTNTITPEKRIHDFTAEHFHSLLDTNVITPLLWLKHLQPYINKRKSLRIVCLSARVGSIEDNGLGGWYSYRASKAALNMLTKTFAIELQRTHPNARVMLFHPGTTDTKLSKPFQKNVPNGKLFTPAFVATQLLTLIQACELESAVTYLDWQGKEIPW